MGVGREERGGEERSRKEGKERECCMTSICDKCEVVAEPLKPLAYRGRRRGTLAARDR